MGEEGRASATIAEKDWRHAYSKHLVELGILGLKSRENALAIAKAGLASARSSFRFVRNGQEMSFEDAIEKFGALPTKFHTGVVVGSGKPATPTVEVRRSRSSLSKSIVEGVNMVTQIYPADTAARKDAHRSGPRRTARSVPPPLSSSSIPPIPLLLTGPPLAVTAA